MSHGHGTWCERRRDSVGPFTSPLPCEGPCAVDTAGSFFPREMGNRVAVSSSRNHTLGRCLGLKMRLIQAVSPGGGRPLRRLPCGALGRAGPGHPQSSAPSAWNTRFAAPLHSGEAALPFLGA